MNRLFALRNHNSGYFGGYALLTLWALWLCSGSGALAQSAASPSNANAPFSVRATHVLGLPNTKNNSNGTLSIQNNALRFQKHGNPDAQVNIASVHSQAPGRGLSSYDASKGGIWMLTRNLALELAPYGITVNAIGPGLVVHTRLGGGTSDEYLNSVLPTIPLGRAGEPDDIAGPVSFLCSDDPEPRGTTFGWACFSCPWSLC